MTGTEGSENEGRVSALPGPGAAPSATDADLEALPPPRRPWRKLTLTVLSATLLGSLALAFSLRGEMLFSLSGQPPHAVGELSGFRPQNQDENTWVQGEGELEIQGAIAY